MSIVEFELDNGMFLSVDEMKASEGLSVAVLDEEGKFRQNIIDITYCKEDLSVNLRTDKNFEKVYIEPECDIPEYNEKLEYNNALIKYGNAGEQVKEVQRRLKELGYFNGVIGGNYLDLTKAAIEDFQLNNGLHVDGTKLDLETYDRLISYDALPAPKPPQKHAKEMDWWKSDIQKIFSKGTAALITDVETGLQWREERRGGTNHADVQPLTKEDTKKLKKAYGGKWAWTRRAIWVTIGNETYAASMNGMPHGSGAIKTNGFDGHHCIHFTNSRTHCSDKICPNHQKMIKKAASVELTI